MIDLTVLFQALITLAAALITYRLVPYLKEKLGNERLETAKIWARAAAAAAEELYQGSGRGEEKLKYVTEFLNDKGFTLDPENLQKIVEAELYSLGLKHSQRTEKIDGI